MSEDKMKDIKDKVVGGVKEATGKVVNDEKLEEKGRLQKGRGKAHGISEDVAQQTIYSEETVRGQINRAIDDAEEDLED